MQRAVLLSVLAALGAPAPASAQATLVHSVDGAAANNLYGTHVAIDGRFVAVGSCTSDVGTPTLPSVYRIEDDRLVLEAELALPAGSSDAPNIAVSGDRVFVGDPTAGGGRVYVYRRDATGGWPRVQTISGPAGGNLFGFSLTAEGELLAVGSAFFERFTTDGRVAVFRRDAAGMYVQAFARSETMASACSRPCQLFGWHVDLSDLTLAVLNRSPSQVFVYDLTLGAGTVVTPSPPRIYAAATYRPSGAPAGEWGESFELSYGRLFVGGYGTADGVDDAGSFDILRDDGVATTANRELSFQPATPHGTNDRFGARVAADGEWAAVGADYDETFTMGPRRSFVHLFRRGLDGVWTPSARMLSPAGSDATGFGSGIAVSGEYVVVGEPGYDTGAMNRGRVHLYRVPVTQFSVDALAAPRPATGTSFGVDVDFDRSSGVFAALGDAATHVYDFDGSTLAAVADIAHRNVATPGFGRFVVVDGTTVMVSDIVTASERGELSFYARTGSAFSLMHTVLGPLGATPEWGFRPERSGAFMLVGGPFDDVLGGVVGVLERPVSGLWETRSTTTTTFGNLFGYAVDIDGDTAVVGCIEVDCDMGRGVGVAHVFRVDPAGTLVLETTLSPPGVRVGAGNTQCGQDVALAGDWAAIGCRYDDASSVADGGAVFVYHREGRTWDASPRYTIRPRGRSAGQRFGERLELQGDILYVSNGGGGSRLSAFRFGTEVMRYVHPVDMLYVADADGNLVSASTEGAPGGGAYLLRAAYPLGALCNTNDECASDSCAAHACVTSMPQPNGAACTSSGMCVSGSCVDGVCCESACSGRCEACAMARTGSADGLCRPVTTGTDPDMECADGRCGASMCNGSRACTTAPLCMNGTACTLGSECTSGNCADGVCCNGACGGECRSCRNADTGMPEGTCGSVLAGTDPASECADTMCAVVSCGMSGCAAAPTCGDLGATCSTATECASGQCVDGVCCNVPCAGSCESCDVADTGGMPGTCAPIRAGLDPDDECADTMCGEVTCGAAGACGAPPICGGNGSLCAVDSECTSGLCADGVCCDARCGGECESCESDHTGVPDGTCAPVTAGTDPAMECPDTACGEVTCAGARACDVVMAMCDAGMPDGGAPDGGRDAGPRDGSVLDATVGDAGGFTDRTPLSCTCRVNSSGPGGNLYVAALALVGLFLLRQRRRLLVMALSLGVLAALPTAASAQTAPAGDETSAATDAASPDTSAAATAPEIDPATEREARALFELGHAHYDNGRFAEAAEEFEHAYTLTHRPQLLYNLYLAYRDAQNIPEARRTLAAYLESDAMIEAALRTNLERRLEAMDGALRTGTTVPEEVETPVDEDGPDEAVVEPTRRTPPTENLSIAPGAIVLGIGGAAILAGAVLGGLALGVQADRDAMCSTGPTGTQCPPGYDQPAAVAQFTTFRDAGWALGLGGAAFAITGAVLMIVGATDDAPATLACTGDGCVAGVSGRF